VAGQPLVSRLGTSVVPFSAVRLLPLIWAIRLDGTQLAPDRRATPKTEKAVDGSSEIVIMTDPQGVITFINPAFTEAYGYTAGEVVGQGDASHPHRWARQPRGLQSLLGNAAGKTQVQGEFINKTKDGRLLTVDVSASAIVDGRGIITGFLGIQRDITKHNWPRRRSRGAKPGLRRLNDPPNWKAGNGTSPTIERPGPRRCIASSESTRKGPGPRWRRA